MTRFILCALVRRSTRGASSRACSSTTIVLFAGSESRETSIVLAPGRSISVPAIAARNASSGAMFKLIFGVLKCIGITMRGPIESKIAGRSATAIVGAPPAAARTICASARRGNLLSRERVPQVAKEHDVKSLGAKMNNRHFIFGQPLGCLENVDRLELDPSKHRRPPAASREAR